MCTWISSFVSFLAALELVLVGKSASSGNFFAGFGFEVFLAARAFLDDFDAVDLGFADVEFASPPLRRWRSSASENPPQSDILNSGNLIKTVEKYNLLDY